MDSQPLDLCPELAMAPGREGQQNVCSPLSPFLWSFGFSDSSCFISSDAVKQAVKKYCIWIFGKKIYTQTHTHTHTQVCFGLPPTTT